MVCRHRPVCWISSRRLSSTWFLRRVEASEPTPIQPKTLRFCHGFILRSTAITHRKAVKRSNGRKWKWTWTEMGPLPLFVCPSPPNLRDSHDALLRRRRSGGIERGVFFWFAMQLIIIASGEWTSSIQTSTNHHQPTRQICWKCSDVNYLIYETDLFDLLLMNVLFLSWFFGFCSFFVLFFICFFKLNGKLCLK